VAEAFRYLVTGLVVPVQPPNLIRAAWDAIMSEAANEGVKGVPQLGALGAEPDQALMVFEQAYQSLLSKNRAALNEQKLDHAAILAMAESVQDCHTAYLTADQWNSVDADLRGSDSIASLPLSFQLASPYLIESVVDGSGAAAQGVHPGDRIIAADGTSLDQIPLSQRKFLSAGAPGSVVRFELESPTGDRRTVVVSREMVSRPLVTSRLIGDVAYIRLRTFTYNLNTVVDPAINMLLSQGARAFVLDLRGNLGGELNADVHLMSRFIPAGVLAITSERSGPASDIRTDGSVLPGPPPLVVLVDGGSLSASELFASDVQQYRAGQLVGASTPGCLLGSTFRTLGDGSSLQISALNVRVGPQDLVVNNTGVQPDVVIQPSADDLAAGRDPQLDRAIAEARSRVSP
jgi:carboxyl-terminal processing protease